MMQPLLTEPNDEDDRKDPEEEYQALLRSLRWTEGFGMLFVECSLPESKRLIARVHEDLVGKTIEVLSLAEPITNLYDLVNALPSKAQINVLFIRGIEHSILDYEANEQWDTPEDRYTYSWKNVPRLLGHLNLSRERFRDSFPFCFVFFVPHFALKYLIRRAPDFFDWRSGVWQFPMDGDRVRKESQQAYSERLHIEEYRELTPQQRREAIIKIKALIDEPQQTSERKANLYLELGLLYDTAKEYENAIASYDRAVAIKADKHEAWNNRGIALGNLGRYEEAIASFNKVLEYEPSNHDACFLQGHLLTKLGRYEEAIISYDKALECKPNDRATLSNRGISLNLLGRHEEAIASFDEALKIEPKNYGDWFLRGLALDYLGRFEEAVASYDRAVRIEPDDYATWFNRGLALDRLERYEEAVTSYDEAIKIEPARYSVLMSRGLALEKLGRHEEAIASCRAAVELLPDVANTLYAQSCSFALKNQVELALESLKSAIELEPQYLERAKTDTDFDLIRENLQFQQLLSKSVENEGK